MEHWATYALVFAANWLFIGLKSFQQRNVAFDNYGWIVPTSMFMAIAEVYIIAKVAQQGFTVGLVVTLGLAGGTGSLAATVLHKYMFQKHRSIKKHG